MNWKPAFSFRGQDHLSTNGEVYATEKEALASAEQRFMVWTMPTAYSAVPTEDPVNGRWVPGQGRVTDDLSVGHVAATQVRVA
jgi:hypothetical protein